MGIIQASIPLFFLFIAAELLFAQLGRFFFLEWFAENANVNFANCFTPSY